MLKIGFGIWEKSHSVSNAERLWTHSDEDCKERNKSNKNRVATAQKFHYLKLPPSCAEKIKIIENINNITKTIVSVMIQNPNT